MFLWLSIYLHTQIDTHITQMTCIFSQYQPMHLWRMFPLVHSPPSVMFTALSSWDFHLFEFEAVCTKFTRFLQAGEHYQTKTRVFRAAWSDCNRFWSCTRTMICSKMVAVNVYILWVSIGEWVIFRVCNPPWPFTGNVLENRCLWLMCWE